jgi:hypothetical protein
MHDYHDTLVTFDMVEQTLPYPTRPVVPRRKLSAVASHRKCTRSCGPSPQLSVVSSYTVIDVPLHSPLMFGLGRWCALFVGGKS